jgi:putative N6-adenine-specific DNA methylase
VHTIRPNRNQAQPLDRGEELPAPTRPNRPRPGTTDSGFLYQKADRYFAQIPDEFAEIAVAELIDLGAQEVKPVYRGIYFTTDNAGLYRINYCTRLLTRVLAALKTFDCHSTKYLYATAITMPWSKIFSIKQTFAIAATVSNSAITHSQYAALCLKDAIVDTFREQCGERPSVDTDNPDIRFNLHVENNHATVSIDTSGGSLHRRGYRAAMVDAPMQETLAAAIIRLSGWQGEVPLYDPLCGSGTLLCEAFMHYCRIPSGYLRNKFGFEQLPDFDHAVWQKVKLAADQQIRALPPGLIIGSDRVRSAIGAARKNCSMLPGGNAIGLHQRELQSIASLENQVIVSNPPYGIRMGADEDLDAFYLSLGDFLKQRCRGSSAYLYFGDRARLKTIGLKATWKKPLKNGGLDGRLAKFVLF